MNAEQEIKRFLPAVALERLISRRLRGMLLAIFGVASGFCLLLGVLLSAFSGIAFSPYIAYGLGLITLSLFLLVLFLTCFWNAFYFWGIDRIGLEEEMGDAGLTYEVAEILSRFPHDLALAFLSSSYGRWVMFRAGASSEAIDAYLGDSTRERLSVETLPIPEHTTMTFAHIASYLFSHDARFKEYLLSQGIREDIFFGAVSWVFRSYIDEKKRDRWWSRDVLGKTRGIGAEFSFGVAYELKRFMKDLDRTTVFSSFSSDTVYAEATLVQLEKILARSKEANVIMVAEPGVGEMDILAELARRLRGGESVSSIEGKHLVVFDTDSFMASYGDKQTFEQQFMSLLYGAASAGNLIIVIEHIGKFFQGAEALGIDVESLLDPYLVSSDVQCIATSDPAVFHQYLETKPRFMQRFSSVLVEAPPQSGTVRVLEDIAPLHEMRENVMFTYSALHAIADSAERYIVEGVMPDKAVDLLVEIAPAMKQKGVRVITEAIVQEHVSQKTGIPSGPVGDKERDTLMRLEETLHKYVIGQQPAIDAISDAMRRARVGVQNTSRPMGSFLFLGPTGVGKTETTKALARVFFGDETKMLRFDMSEYNGADALARLMGSRAESGALTSKLHEHPYGVLLLDEFEKANRDVHDLFLQILDEGIFTDGRGAKINARNLIIIATSNAGSDMLWDIVKRGEKPGDHKDEIIAHLIEGGVYRPELINRFDGVIIFEPLTKEEMHHVARLLLQGLQDRMKQKGFVLDITDPLIEFLVEKGYDPVFGVRPMRRVMQDVIEGKIAEKMISGSLHLGDHITFTNEDLKQ